VTIRSNGTIRRQLRTLFNLGAIGELSDGQLLERFATQDGEAAELAFAALVERHGPMVVRVCRKTLRDPNDVEDAFQATFLVLVQKGRSLWVRDSLGPWLHRVAHRVATRARSSAAGRREHERRAAATRPTRVSEPDDREDLEAILHQEIDRLPERYRAPVVLCELQGLNHEKAARHLGCPVGTVKTRLARARELLRGRLSHRGLGRPAGLLIAEKGLGGAFRAVEVVVTDTLVDTTVRAAVPFAAGKALAVGVISSRVAILIEEGLKTMFLTKLRMATAVLLLIGAAGAAGVLAQPGSRSGANPVPPTPDRPAAPAPAPAPAPAYITQSRAMIITRLEEEVAEAGARLNRSRRKARSPDDPAVLRARKTFQDLQQRLDRIDQVLVDVVETYPTMVDFSSGPSDSAPTSQSPAGPVRNTENARRGHAAASTDEADLARRKDRAEWAKRMFDRGYVSKSQLDAEVADYDAMESRPQASQAQQGWQQGDRDSQKPGSQRGQQGQAQPQGQQGNAQGQKSQGQGQGQQGNAQGQKSQGQAHGQQGNSQGQRSQGQAQGQQGHGQRQGQVQSQQGSGPAQQGQGKQSNDWGQQSQGQQGQGQGQLDNGQSPQGNGQRQGQGQGQQGNGQDQ
jgi:RNA polymerase sigma factor (sigma-70 family)